MNLLILAMLGVHESRVFSCLRLNLLAGRRNAAVIHAQTIPRVTTPRVGWNNTPLVWRKSADAEWYIGGYGGLSNPGAFSNVTLSDSTLADGVTNARLNDLELKGGLTGGAKGGYFFVNHPWLGLETDVFTLTPDVKTQTVVGGTASGRVFADTLPRIPLRLTTWTANIIIRSPSMSEVFQPYGGMGYGMFFATSSKNGTSNVHVSPGLNLLPGLGMS